MYINFKENHISNVVEYSVCIYNAMSSIMFLVLSGPSNVSLYFLWCKQYNVALGKKNTK